MEKKLSEQLREYLNITPKEQLEKDWAEACAKTSFIKPMLPNVLIELNGVVSKQDNSVISEKECSEIMDSFLELLEKKGCCYGGGYFLTAEVK